MWIVMRLYEGIGNDARGPVQEVELDSDMETREMIGEGLAALFYGRTGGMNDVFCVEVVLPDYGMSVREGAWYPFNEDDTNSGKLLMAAVDGILGCSDVLL